jgi:hypothetical protein
MDKYPQLHISSQAEEKTKMPRRFTLQALRDGKWFWLAGSKAHFDNLAKAENLAQKLADERKTQVRLVTNELSAELSEVFRAEPKIEEALLA